MGRPKCLALLICVLFWGSSTRADVVDPTPHNYDHPPKKGREGGTFAFNSTGSLGPDCVFAITGTAKQLPNKAGTGGQVCAKFNLEVSGTGPFCSVASQATSQVNVVGGPYTDNGDGTLCENLVIIGGPAAGTAATFHTFVDPKGQWLLPTSQDIAYGAPGSCPTGR